VGDGNKLTLSTPEKVRKGVDVMVGASKVGEVVTDVCAFHEGLPRGVLVVVDELASPILAVPCGESESRGGVAVGLDALGKAIEGVGVRVGLDIVGKGEEDKVIEGEGEDDTVSTLCVAL